MQSLFSLTSDREQLENRGSHINKHNKTHLAFSGHISMCVCARGYGARLLRLCARTMLTTSDLGAIFERFNYANEIVHCMVCVRVHTTGVTVCKNWKMNWIIAWHAVWKCILKYFQRSHILNRTHLYSILIFHIILKFMCISLSFSPPSLSLRPVQVVIFT